MVLNEKGAKIAVEITIDFNKRIANNLKNRNL